MMKKFLLSAVTTAVVATFGTSASAAVSLVTSITGNPTGYTSIAGMNLLTDFETGGLTANYFTATSEAAIVTGSPAGSLQPLNDATKYLTVPNSDSGSFAIGTNPYEATLNIPNAVKTIGFYWGSPDSDAQFNGYNSVSLYSGGTSGTFLGTYTGGNLFSDLGLNPTGANGNSMYVQLWAGGTPFDTVVFGASAQAFEIDNIATSVPEPGEWAMMIAGLGVVSLIARRRKSAA
jgi:hypothetical protein